MSLREKLRKAADYSDKYSYKEIVGILEKSAIEGKYSIEIIGEDVLAVDMERLKEEGLKVELIEGKDYNYYYVSWE